LVFEKKNQFYHRKLAKIVENCEHNIDPRLREILPHIVRMLSKAVFFKLQKYKNMAQIFGPLLTAEKVRQVIYFGKNGLGYVHFGRFFHKLIWSP
jgi:hypothetical protein